MSVIRIVKDKNFVTMGKYHLKEKDMSLKAIGLLSIMLSLPDDWDYSISGLVSIRKESYDSIRTTLKELEQFGYLKRTQILDKGKFVDVEYTIYEKPLTEKPITEKPLTENQTQLNTNIINNLINKKLNNKKEIYKERFVKPSLEEIETYCKERNNNVDPKTFYDFYETGDWKDSKGNKVKNWKQKVITWERDSKAKPQVEKKSKQRLFFEEMMRKAEEEDRLEQERSNNLNGQD